MTAHPAATANRVSIVTIAREWSRIGVTGFGGPPAHIALLRKLCVDQRGWIAAREFEDSIAAVNLLPGPASTQLAIFCAWRLRGTLGAVVGGVCFIVPGLIIILGLSTLFLASHPPLWVEAAAAGAGAAVPAVALQASISLLPASWNRAGGRRPNQVRWAIDLVLGGAAAATIGPFLVLILLVSGLVEVATKVRRDRTPPPALGLFTIGVMPAAAIGGIASLAWVAFKVGAAPRILQM